MSIGLMNTLTETMGAVTAYITEQKIRIANKKEVETQLSEIQKEIVSMEGQVDLFVRAATLLGTVSDESTEMMLGKITGVINRALAEMFSEDKRSIELKQNMYRNMYPHYTVELKTAEGKKRTFKQSGTGLAQIISFLFNVCLIDAKKGRKIMVMDELLNGLHPEAKVIVLNLINILSDKFQFVIVEYGLDIGKEYLVSKSGPTASISELPQNSYYRELGVAFAMQADE